MANTLNQMDMKNINLIEVLRIIKDKKYVTRKDVQKYSGLSWGGTSQIITNLMEKRLIINSKDNDTAVSGRRPEVLSLNNDDNYVIGLDINVSGIYSVIINLGSQVIDKTETSVSFDNKDSFISSVKEFIRNLMNKYPDKTFMGIGVSMQGRVDEKNGVSKEFIGIDDWVDVPIETILTQEFDIPVSVAHDPECLLTAYGTNTDSMLIRMDFDIGMAIKKNNALISAEGMLEVGKFPVTDGKGQLVGKLADYTTISGIEKKYPNFIESIAKNDANTQKVFDDMSAHLGYALSAAMILFDVNKLILCGKMTDWKDFFYDKTRDIMSRCIGDMEIVFYDVKNAAIGAAEIAINKKILNI